MACLRAVLLMGAHTRRLCLCVLLEAQHLARDVGSGVAAGIAPGAVVRAGVCVEACVLRMRHEMRLLAPALHHHVIAVL